MAGNALDSLLAVFNPKGGNTTSTKQLDMSAAGVQALVQQQLERADGLAAVAGGQRGSGLYNSSTNSMLANDLLSRITGDVAARTAKTVETKQAVTKNQASSDLLKILAAQMSGSGVAKKVKGTLEEALGGKKKPTNTDTDGAGTKGGGTGTGDGTSSDTAAAAQSAGGVAGNVVTGTANTEDVGSTLIGGATSSDIASTIFSGDASGIDLSSLFGTSSSAGGGDIVTGGYGNEVISGIGGDSIDTSSWSASDSVDYSGLINMDYGSSASSDSGSSSSGGDYSAPAPVYTPPPASSGGGGSSVSWSTSYDDSGDSGGDSVICTELHNGGELSNELYLEYVKVFHLIPVHVVVGYHSWAKPYVAAMKKYRALRWIALPFAIGRARHITGRKNLFGWATIAIGEPICGYLGKRIIAARKAEVMYG